jgi:hypothetical protein
MNNKITDEAKEKYTCSWLYTNPLHTYELTRLREHQVSPIASWSRRIKESCAAVHNKIVTRIQWVLSMMILRTTCSLMLKWISEQMIESRCRCITSLVYQRRCQGSRVKQLGQHYLPWYRYRRWSPKEQLLATPGIGIPKTEFIRRYQRREKITLMDDAPNSPLAISASSTSHWFCPHSLYRYGVLKHTQNAEHPFIEAAPSTS